jgi:hypothetical protein
MCHIDSQYHDTASRGELLDWFDIKDVDDDAMFYGKNPAGHRTGN